MSILKKPLINPRYRWHVWALILLALGFVWYPVVKAWYIDQFGVSFTHTDQELLVTCQFDQRVDETIWECTNHQGVNFDKFNPDLKKWVYSTEDGEVVVERYITLGEANFELSHPKLRKTYKATLS